jgi:hypothetical protein
MIQARQRGRRAGRSGRPAGPRSDEGASAAGRLVRATIAPRVTTRLNRDGRSLAARAVSNVRTPEHFYAIVETAIPAPDERLRIFVDEYRLHRAAAGRPLAVLEVVCYRSDASNTVTFSNRWTSIQPIRVS